MKEARAYLSAVVVVASVVGALALSACEGPPPRPRDWRDDTRALLTSSTEAEPSPSAASGAGAKTIARHESLRIHLNADPGSLHPMREPSQWAIRITRDTVFETLLRYGPKAAGQGAVYSEGLAKSWSVSPGGREIRVFLNEAARFHDGKAVTALDVQNSLDAARMKRGGAEHHRRALSDITAVEIVSRDQVRIRLARENAYVLRELAAVPILPESLLASVPVDPTSWVGSGPYRLVRVDDEAIVLERIDDYWGTAPAIPRIEFLRYGDSARALREAKEGAMDFVPELIAEHYPEQVEGALAKGLRVVTLDPANFPYVVVNTETAPFRDVRVRRAIDFVVDREAMVKASKGLSRAVAGPVWPGGPGDAKSPAASRLSIEDASQLLDESGWRDDDGDGVRTREGKRLMVTVLATEEDNEDRQAFLTQLRKLGFVLDLRVGSSAVLHNRLRSGEFDLAFATWSGESDRNLGNLLASGGIFNYGRYQSDTIEALLSQARAAWDPAERSSIVLGIGEAVRHTLPVIALPAPDPHGVLQTRVQGAVFWNGWLSLRDLQLEGGDR